MNIEKRNEKQMFQKREAWSNGRDSQKADIVIAKWLIKDSISVLFYCESVAKRLCGLRACTQGRIDIWQSSFRFTALPD